MYLGSSVMYGSSQSIQTPSWSNSSSIATLFSSANSLHLSTNLSIPISSISCLDWMFIRCSTLFSIGNPCMSHPACLLRLNPFMDLYLRYESLMILFHAVPRWIFPLQYGGPSRNEYLGPCSLSSFTFLKVSSCFQNF